MSGLSKKAALAAAALAAAERIDAAANARFEGSVDDAQLFRALAAELLGPDHENAGGLTPEFSIGETVSYDDHHGRSMVGTVLSIEGRWPRKDARPYLTYEVSHPSYRNRRIYIGARNMTGGDRG